MNSCSWVFFIEIILFSRNETTQDPSLSSSLCKREVSEANFVGKWTRLETSLFHYLVWLKIQLLRRDTTNWNTNLKRYKCRNKVASPAISLPGLNENTKKLFPTPAVVQSYCECGSFLSTILGRFNPFFQKICMFLFFRAQFHLHIWNKILFFHDFKIFMSYVRIDV